MIQAGRMEKNNDGAIKPIFFSFAPEVSFFKFKPINY